MAEYGLEQEKLLSANVDVKLKELLKVAEAEIISLYSDCDEYARMINQLIDSQAAQDMQLAEMTGQIRTLESIILNSDEQMSEAIDLISNLINGMEVLRAQVQETLKAAEKNATKVELKERVKVIANTAEVVIENKMLAAYKRKVAERKRRKTTH